MANKTIKNTVFFDKEAMDELPEVEVIEAKKEKVEKVEVKTEDSASKE